MAAMKDRIRELKEKADTKQETRSVRMQLLITPSIASDLQKLADESDVSKNEIVNVALEKYMHGE